MTPEELLTRESEETRRADGETSAESWWKSAAFLAWLFSQEDFDRGELAALRRMDISQPHVPMYWRLMNYRGLLGETTSVRWERKWAVIFKGIALMTRNTPPVICAHNRQIAVGRALYGDGDNPLYSQRRLDRLLRLSDDSLLEALLAVCRRMHSARASLNWGELALMILHEGLNEQRATAARTRIAREYYRAEFEAKRDRQELQ